MPERRMIITAPVHGQDNIDVEGCYSVHRASAVLPLVGLTCDGVGRDKQKTDSRFDNPPSSGASIGGVPRFMGGL